MDFACREKQKGTNKIIKVPLHRLIFILKIILQPTDTIMDDQRDEVRNIILGFSIKVRIPSECWTNVKSAKNNFTTTICNQMFCWIPIYSCKWDHFHVCENYFNSTVVSEVLIALNTFKARNLFASVAVLELIRLILLTFVPRYRINSSLTTLAKSSKRPSRAPSVEMPTITIKWTAGRAAWWKPVWLFWQKCKSPTNISVSISAL